MFQLYHPVNSITLYDPVLQYLYDQPQITIGYNNTWLPHISTYQEFTYKGSMIS